MEKLSISYIQSDIVWENRDQNLNRFEQLIGTIKENTDIIVLPEMFTTGFSMFPAAIAEQMDGPTLNWMKAMAAQNKSALIGSVIIEEQNRFYNRLIFVSPEGNIQTYDKKHLFRMAGEDKQYSPGHSSIIISYKNWRIKPLVCYDLRFPVWSRNRDDYDLLVYVANWPGARTTVWEALLVARAIENQTYCLGVNRIGQDGHGTKHKGGSMLVDAKGTIINRAQYDTESIESAHLNLNDLKAFRAKFPVHLDADDFKIF